MMAKSHISLEETCDTEAVLGIQWNLLADTLSCDLRGLDDLIDEPVTKRKILSVVHKIFDPIGFTCPITLIPKILLQDCWQLKVTWDTELPESVVLKFKNWKQQLIELKEVKIPRQLVGLSRPITDVSLHVFCDASKVAYATCVFLRVEDGVNISCQLVQGKSRIAPIKTVTIPRLELLACCIGARLASSVKRDLHFENVRTFYWSDSTDALYWIKKDDSWGTFVMNRVKEIRSISDPDNWNYIAGSKNPADLPSRGCSVKILSETKWWEGPNWLKQPIEHWPHSEAFPNIEVINAEKKKTVVSAISSVSDDDKYYSKFSSYTKLLRITAWIYRFYKNAKDGASSRVSGELQVSELRDAEFTLLRSVQRDSFSLNDDRIRTLLPVTDTSGLIRVKTRILMRKDLENFRYPILLPAHHPVVNLLIMWKHIELGHAGVQTLMTDLRENYWIIRSRRTIKQVVRQCVRCRRFTARHPEVIMAPLPEDRVREAAVFEIVGVDLAGPLFLKGGQKAWIVLYTCAVFRAVHLELVTSISMESFLQTLRRFIARRGRPTIIYSDNGSNLVGSNNALKKINWNDLPDTVSVKKITWKFIPPSAPWWGGWWERLIGLMKQILRRVLARASLHYEELYTVLCDTESIINSRPLTYVSDDIQDMLPLTPAMFLQESREMGVPDLDYLDTVGLNKRYAYRMKIRDNLKKRFRNEYLGYLRQNAKLTKTTQSIKVGDVMLMGSDNMKRIDWPLARVIEIFEGKDGLVRVARVKTRSGEVLRPIKRLYPLELNQDESDLLRMRKEFFRKTETVDEKKYQKIAEKTSPNIVEKLSESSGNEVGSNIIKTRSGRVVMPPSRFNLNLN